MSRSINITLEISDHAYNIIQEEAVEYNGKPLTDAELPRFLQDLMQNYTFESVFSQHPQGERELRDNALWVLELFDTDEMLNKKE